MKTKCKKQKKTQETRKWQRERITKKNNETSVILVILPDCYLHPVGSIVMNQTSTSVAIISYPEPGIFIVFGYSSPIAQLNVRQGQCEILAKEHS